MNLTTWLDEQARLVRGAPVSENLNGARNTLRFIFEDDAPEGIRPDMIIRLALFPLDEADLGVVRDTFIRQTHEVFVREGRTDDLDREIRAALYRDRHRVTTQREERTMDETKTGTDSLIERIVEDLNTDTSPEWNPAPSWADYVLTWEGLRGLANDLMGRRPYDGRNPLAEPVLRDLLTLSLNNEGFVILPRNCTDDGNKHYGPLCPQHEARHKYEARKVGKVPDPSWAGAVCVDCCRTVDGATQEVTIYVW